MSYIAFLFLFYLTMVLRNKEVIDPFPDIPK